MACVHNREGQRNSIIAFVPIIIHDIPPVNFGNRACGPVPLRCRMHAEPLRPSGNDYCNNSAYVHTGDNGCNRHSHNGIDPRGFDSWSRPDDPRDL